MPVLGFTTNRVALDIVEELCNNSGRSSGHSINNEQQPSLILGLNLICHGILSIVYACTNVLVNLLQRYHIIMCMTYACTLVKGLRRASMAVMRACNVFISLPSNPVIISFVTACNVVIVLLLLCLTDFITPSKDDIHTNYVIYSMVYVCKSVTHVFIHSVLYVLSTCKVFMIAFLHSVTYVVSACSTTIAALQAQCLTLIDLITPSEDRVYICMYYVIFCVAYACKVFIIYSLFWIFALLIDPRKADLKALPVWRRKTRDWFANSFLHSLLYLFFHCMSLLLVTGLQFVLSFYADTYFISGVTFSSMYSCITLIIVVCPDPTGKVTDDQTYPKLMNSNVSLYCCHMITHFIMSIDWNNALMRI